MLDEPKVQEESQKRRGQGCFSTGCGGCALAVALLIAIPLLLLLAVVLIGSPEPRPESARLSHRLPSFSSSGVEAPEVPPDLSTGEDLSQLPSSAEPLDLVLDLSKGSFTLEPGPVGSELAVKADYNSASYELVERYDPEGRRYELEFDARGGMLGLLRSRGGDLNEVTITVPRGYPIRLTGRLSMGQSRVEIGGLAIESADLEFRAGDHVLLVSEPVPRPLEWIEVDAQFGQLEIVALGNASPRQSRFSQRAGNLRLDLEGAWRENADLELECRFGECRVIRPEGIRTVIERAAVSFGEKTVTGDVETADGAEAGTDEAPVLRLWISADAGDLDII